VLICDNLRTPRWPELSKAIALCKTHAATLLIAELATLTNNEAFTQLLLDNSDIKFHCLDQPFINHHTLEALSKHAQHQRTLHGLRIKKGLEMTTKKLGNPNATKVIGKVNEPKIDTAIIFACLLSPIIEDYKTRQLSQRQMVKTLNEEGFLAPEGGKWVLSQLQKVLDRIKLNDMAFAHRDWVADCASKGLDNTQIVASLNERQIPPLKSPHWTEAQFKKLNTRIDNIAKITSLNHFLLNFLPILKAAQTQKITQTDLLEMIEKDDLPAHTAMLQENFKSLPKDIPSLAARLESCTKHLKPYQRIIQTHIAQLKTVLALNSHNQKTLDDIKLAKPIYQLMDIFKELSEEGITYIDNLAQLSKNWSANPPR